MVASEAEARARAPRVRDCRHVLAPKSAAGTCSSSLGTTVRASEAIPLYQARRWLGGSGSRQELAAIWRQAAGTGGSEGGADPTNSAIAVLNLAGSSTKGSWPESSNQTTFLDGA